MLLESDKKILGEIIKKHRKEKRLTQFELAEKIGLNEKQIYRIETGINYPTYTTFAKLVEILDIDITNIEKSEKSQTIPELNQINGILKCASIQELKIYLDVIKTLKKNFKSFE